MRSDWSTVCKPKLPFAIIHPRVSVDRPFDWLSSEKLRISLARINIPEILIGYPVLEIIGNLSVRSFDFVQLW